MIIEFDSNWYNSIGNKVISWFNFEIWTVHYQNKAELIFTFALFGFEVSVTFLKFKKKGGNNL